jgi:signal transduction histidine kinase
VLGHWVQFYEGDSQLVQGVCDFLAEGSRRQEQLLVICTGAHHQAIVQGLTERGFPPERQRMVHLDAAQTLSRLMKDSLPDPEAFRQTVEPILERMQSEGHPVRCFGEMVDLLWRQGNSRASIRLEELWNDLQGRHSFSILFGYAMAGFFKQPSEVDRVSGLSVVAPSQLDNLAAELRTRRQMEDALREALRERRQLAGARELIHRRSEQLHRAISAIAEAVTREQVFEALVDQVAGALGADGAALWLVEGSVARMARAFRYPPEAQQRFAQVPLDCAPPLPITDSLRSGEMLWLSGPELIGRYPHLATAITPGRTRYAIAALPILFQGQALGVLGLTFDEPPGLEEGNRAHLIDVARWSGQALERLRLLEAERESRLRTERLYKLARVVVEADSVDRVFQGALEGLGKAAIRTLEGDGQLRLRAHRELDEPPATAEVLWDRHAGGWEQRVDGEAVHFPLVANNQLLGALSVYQRVDLQLAQAIADQVSAALPRFAAVAELKRTVRYNELFTGILGHDLRNPLSAILTSAQIALSRGEGEKLIRPLSRILSSGLRMARMVDQLLDFTRVRVGSGIPLKRRPMDLLPLVRQAMDELDSAFPEGTLRLEHHGDTLGEWDPDRLAQVVSNLVANALQHGALEAGVKVRIDGEAPHQVALTIHNMGAIPPDRLSSVFEPMSGGEHRLEKSRGLGLGLYIGREIVQSHQGLIEVSSTQESGTTVTVVLPRGNPT